MSRNMLIDASHPEETRVAVLDGDRLEEFDFESQTHKQIRGNIYLARVTRVEPSLQAAFVEYGGNRHGFLAFGEIHPDYYQIPTADRQALLAEQAADAYSEPEPGGEDGAEDDDDLSRERARRAAMRRYKIQEVIKRRQILLVQVVKEERGNKGAALTTYLSLAGRYGVLMPNTPRGGGISRKITAGADRTRLKRIVQDLGVPEGMGLIVRTAGAKRTKTEIKRDYEYLIRLWENIRTTTLQSIAPALIHEEDSLVKRAIRDMYDKDVDTIHVDGDGAYREAKDFVKMLMPSQSKKVQQHKEVTPLFATHGVEGLIEQIHNPVVQLKSGGYIVINQTEALVAIDVNSGRATRERSIESTALKTNLEAADEACRQMRLRDLAGLIVIDFIDMEEAKNDRAVEKRMKDALKSDRARLQMGRISNFGLLEISRQRRRSSILEGSSHVCPTCNGSGRIRSAESTALAVLRILEDRAGSGRVGALTARVSVDAALYLLNEKRDFLMRIETRTGVSVRVLVETSFPPGRYEVEASAGRRIDYGDDEDAPPPPQRPRPVVVAIAEPGDEPEADETEDTADEEDRGAEKAADGDGRRRRRRRRRRGGGGQEAGAARGQATTGDGETASDEAADGEDGDVADGAEAAPAGETEAEGEARRRRRRGRRGGRRRREDGGAAAEGAPASANAEDGDAGETAEAADDGAEASDADEAAVKPDDAVIIEAEPEAVSVAAEPVEAAQSVAGSDPEPAEPEPDAVAAKAEAASVPEAEPNPDPAPAPAEPEAAIVAAAPEPEPVTEPVVEPVSEPEADPKPKRSGWWARKGGLFGQS